MNKVYSLSALITVLTLFSITDAKNRVALYPLLANVISGNAGDGVLITNQSDDNTVAGNVIGTDLSGSLNLGNGGVGVRINYTSSDNTIGGSTTTAGNLIAFNQKGVVVGEGASDLSVSNTILNNGIYSNKLLIGIDLADDGHTPNHATSPTPGPNDFQNFPVLTSFTPNAAGLSINWTLKSVPSSDFLLQFFSNQPNDPEGKRVIGNTTTVTDANGNASGSIQVGAVPVNTPLTATATIVVDEVPGDTSEFSFPALTYGVVKPCPAKPCNTK